MDPWQVEVCSVDERRAALTLLLSRLPDDLVGASVAQLLAPTSGVDLTGLLACRSQSRLLGAILCIESPGRTMIFWPPRISAGLAPTDDRDVQISLMRSARSFASQRQVRFVNALLDDADSDVVPLFVAHGFFRATRLLYLHRAIDERPVNARLPDVQYVGYSLDRHAAFVEVVAQSYVGSLDCPELNGVREREEILEGHRAQGRFVPERWLLAQYDGTIIGCLLLGTWDDLSALEIAYVAVLPGWRGRGFGHELIREAIRQAVQAKLRYITAAVDSRNLPAVRLYEQEGFTQWESREVYLLVLDPAERKIAPNVDSVATQ